ncbi:hypothetical protein DFH27DRAFT_539400 [Peziza echinospora]|nr:hypothetical protein DFH27DRAFT_539400 [Peziza echinospora]
MLSICLSVFLELVYLTVPSPPPPQWIILAGGMFLVSVGNRGSGSGGFSFLFLFLGGIMKFCSVAIATIFNIRLGLGFWFLFRLWQVWVNVQYNFEQTKL